MMDFFDNILGSESDGGQSIEVVSRIQTGEPDDGLLFELRRGEGGDPISLSELREATADFQLERGALIRTSILARLYADELVRESEPGTYRLPFRNVYELDDVERRALDLELQHDWEVYVDVDGVIGSGENPLDVRCDPPWGLSGPELSEMREVACGFVEEGSERLHVLPGGVVRIRELADARVATDTDSRAAEYRLLGKLSKTLESASPATREMVTLDRQLEDEEYAAPDEVRVDFRVREDGSLELRPLVDGFDDFQSAEAILEAGSDERLFQRETDKDQSEGKLRVALDDSTLREVNRVRERSEVPPDEAGDFIEQPREYLQPAEEFREECEREADQSGASVDDVIEERVEDETLNLEPAKERISRLNVQDYGDRVQGFRRRADSEQRDDRERGVEVEGKWFEPPEESTGASKASEEASQSDDEATAPESGRHLEESGVSTEGEGSDTEAGASSGVQKDEQVDPDAAADVDGIELVTADNDAELAYEAVAEGKTPAHAEELDEPSPFDGELYPYQSQGFTWLTALSESGGESDEGGGLLADDTGLGKTVQIIALLARRLDNDALSPSLLVVPKTLMPNWESEIREFCPEIDRIYRHHGTGRLENAEKITRQQVVITTYGTLCADQLVLGKIEFEVMACDEAQKIKNYTTKRAAACRAMDAKLKIPLTATPVENTLEDLWSIMDFCQPGMLDTLPEFRESFADPIEQPDDEGERQRAASDLLTEIRGHYVRRRKDEVLADELPPKEVHSPEVPLTARQKEAYRTIREAYDRTGGRGKVFEVINNLLRVCTHPLVVSDRDEGIAAALDTRDPEDVCGAEREVVAESGKLEYVFEEVLPAVRDAGQKALIFTQFRRSQVLAQMLVQGYFEFLPTVINGDASGSQRQAAVDQFCNREGFDVLVLSPRAAGVGLNIQAANHVIHLTREWNPAKEKQAADRVYRIGQEREVHEYTPVSASNQHDETADERLAKLLEEKRQMAETVMHPGDNARVPTAEFEDLV
jgi:hypothetical protein